MINTEEKIEICRWIRTLEMAERMLSDPFNVSEAQMWMTRKLRAQNNLEKLIGYTSYIETQSVINGW